MKSFGLGAVIGAGAVLLVQQWIYRPKVEIDHVVVRCKNSSLDAVLSFYSFLGFKVERLEEYKNHQADSSSPLAFPVVRLNDSQVIDIFPEDLSRIHCQRSTGPVDHICLVFEDGNRLLEAMDRLRFANIPIHKHFKASGARGTGYSVYVYHPEDLWFELRTYDETFWRVIAEKAELMTK